MRNKVWLVALFGAGILVGLGATSVFAQGPADQDDDTWEEMHQACQTGDYEAMAKLHEQCTSEEGGMMSGNWTGGMMGNGGGTMGNAGGMMGNAGGMMGNDSGMMGSGQNGMMGSGQNGMMGSGQTDGGMMGGGMMGGW